MPSPYVIAIDPGHGGSPTSDPTQLWDPGVVVGNVMEKDITLDLAFRLRTLLQKERVKVVLTRTGDEYVEHGKKHCHPTLSVETLSVPRRVSSGLKLVCSGSKPY